MFSTHPLRKCLHATLSSVLSLHTPAPDCVVRYRYSVDNQPQAMRMKTVDEGDDRTIFMQRWKRGRSSSPRRRRRHQRQEEERRANRQKWCKPNAAPGIRTSTCSTARLQPRHPWTRSSTKRTAPNVTVDLEAEGAEHEHEGGSGAGEPARGSRDPPPLPTLDEVQPAVRWWTDLLGMTDALNETEGQRVIAEDTFRTIVANLQGQNAAERSRNVAALLQFFGMFLAELMRAVWESEHGDTQILLQISSSVPSAMATTQWSEIESEMDTLALMQHFKSTDEGEFRQVLRQIQDKLEHMSRAAAARIAACVGTFLHEHNQVKGRRRPQHVLGRLEALGALMAAYEDSNLVTHEVVDPWCIDVWRNTLLQFLEGPEGVHEASSSHCCAAAGVGEGTEDRSQGYRVREADKGWRPATETEAKEFAHHDRQLRQEAEQQRKEDEATFERLEAAKAQEWEDWALHSELSKAAVPRKRVRLTIVVGGAAGSTVAEGVVEGVMPSSEQPLISIGLVETPILQRAEPEQDVAQENLTSGSTLLVAQDAG